MANYPSMMTNATASREKMLNEMAANIRPTELASYADARNACEQPSKPTSSTELAQRVKTLSGGLIMRLEALADALASGPSAQQQGQTSAPLPPMGLNDHLNVAMDTLEKAHSRLGYIANYLGLEV